MTKAHPYQTLVMTSGQPACINGVYKAVMIPSHDDFLHLHIELNHIHSASTWAGLCAIQHYLTLINC